MKAVDVVDRQVEAYNAHDVEAFSAWYEEDIKVWSMEDTHPNINSLSKLKEVYGKKFENPALHVEISNRITMGSYVIDHEKIQGAGEKPTEAVVIYLVRGNRIQTVTIIR
jgi:hypothetical protein